MRTIKFFMLISTFFGASAIIIGAFAAHGLKPYLTHTQIEVIKTAVYYQLFHAILLFNLSIWLITYKNLLLIIACLLVVIGIVLFSGSLYLLTLWQIPVGLITPIGGIFIISAWLLLTINAVKLPTNKLQ